MGLSLFPQLHYSKLFNNGLHIYAFVFLNVYFIIFGRTYGIYVALFPLSQPFMGQIATFNDPHQINKVLLGGFLMSDEKKNQVENSTRRTFLKNSGFALGGLVVGGTVGGLLGTNKENENTETKSTEPVANPNVALMFFYPAEYETTTAAAERIFPKNKLGPGAADLNVGIYIDHQLANRWGVNARDYRHGPFYDPAPTQGDQVKILRNDLFRLGLNGLDDYSNKNYQSKFTNLEAADQDEVLIAFENGKGPSLSGVSSSNFFRLLRQLTMEGIYADPMYGGNKEMQGWRMRKYPGTRMSFVEEIKSDKFIEMDQQSLHSHMGQS